MEVVKVSPLEDTVVNEPNRVDQPERVKRLDHQRNTQTNSLSQGESQDESWAERGKQKKLVHLHKLFCLASKLLC